MGEEDAKAPVLYVGNCLFTGSQRRNNSAGNGVWRFVGKYPLTPNTCVCGAHFDGGKWQDTFFPIPARLVWTKPPKKERLSHVRGQAARFLDEADMEVDENIISAGKLADCKSLEAADKEEGHVSWEGNVQDHVKALRTTASQFEAGCMTACLMISWRRGKKLWNSTRVECCSCGREPSETRKSQTLLYTRLKQPPELIKFYTGIDVECIEFLLHHVGWFCERIVSTHCTAGHVKFQSRWW